MANQLDTQMPAAKDMGLNDYCCSYRISSGVFGGEWSDIIYHEPHCRHYISTTRGAGMVSTEVVAAVVDPSTLPKTYTDVNGRTRQRREDYGVPGAYSQNHDA